MLKLEKKFEKKGYLIKEKFYSKKELKIISDWISSLANKSQEQAQIRKYFEKSKLIDRSILSRIEYFFDENNYLFKNLLINTKLKKLLKVLFKDNPVLFKEKVNFKPPGSRCDKLHQDQAAGWNKYASHFITVMIALDKNTKKNGAIHISNEKKIKRKLISKEWEPIQHEDLEQKPKKGFVILELNPGDIVFFDSYVPHGSPINRSKNLRRNIFLTFNRLFDGDNRIRYFKDKLKTYPPNIPEKPRNEDTFKV